MITFAPCEGTVVPVVFAPTVRFESADGVTHLVMRALDGAILARRRVQWHDIAGMRSVSAGQLVLWSPGDGWRAVPAGIADADIRGPRRPLHVTRLVGGVRVAGVLRAFCGV